MNKEAIARLQIAVEAFSDPENSPHCTVRIFTTDGAFFVADGFIEDILEVESNYVRLNESRGGQRWWLVDPRTIGSVEIS